MTEEVVDIAYIPDEDLRRVLQLLFDHLKLRVVQESWQDSPIWHYRLEEE